MNISKRESCDVLVCGGGSAGVAAAIAAARLGASTILVERYGFCGGVCVSSLVHTFDGLRNCRKYEQLVVGGIPLEVVEELRRNGGLVTKDNPPECLCFDPERMKLAADVLLCRAGVRLLYHLFVVGVVKEGPRVQSVVAAGKEGLWEISAQHFIDATGDGDVGYFAGAEYEKDPAMQTMSTHFRVGGLKGRSTWHQLEQACRKAMDAAYAAGRAPKYGGPWIIRIREGEASFNCTRLYGDATDTRQLTQAEIQARQDLMGIWSILRESVPDFRDSFVLVSGVQVGVRETRRLMGDYVITAEDIERNRPFEDAVALGSWPIDIHPANGEVGVHAHKESPPEPYQIPERAMLVRGLDNLLAVGRCLSSTHEAHGSTRVSGTAMAVGQAGGTLAGLAFTEGLRLRDVRIQMLQERLLQDAVILEL
ncbi:MAG: FAD-dependent oxidoreductase [Acidobacteria bacterium]|nr:FAD-dependent oxidoreductase [Acidobacteriota bacterium]